MKRKSKKAGKLGVRKKPPALLTDRPIFDPEEQLIYRFKINGKIRAIDPMRIAAKLATSSDLLNHLMKLVRLPVPDAGNSIIEASAIIRSVFDLPELSVSEEGVVSGCSDAVCLGIYADFADWADEVKKKLPPLPTAWKSSEAAGSPVADLPTRNTTEFTSIDRESSSDEPFPLPWVSPPV